MANPVVTLLNERHASRAVDTRPLSEEQMADLAEAIRLTPSCFNNQPWRYLFLISAGALDRGRQALTGGNRAWATRAPLLVLGYAPREDDCVLDDGRAYHQFDLGLSAMNLMLAATGHGLIARPMAGFDPTALKQSFDLGPEDEPLIMIAVGYKAEDESYLPERYRSRESEPRTRKAVNEIIRYL
jgi:nitroreductase